MNTHISSLVQELLKGLQEVVGRMLEQHTLTAGVIVSSPDGLPRLYNKQEIMAYLGISIRTYERYKKRGVITVRRVGRMEFSTEEDLQLALEESIRKGRL